jgi:molybdopterin converting factor small subunit
MITVHVRVFATLRQYCPDLRLGETMAVELAEGGTVGELIRQLELPGDLVKIVFVNHAIRRDEHMLGEGDEVGIFPPVAGG